MVSCDISGSRRAGEDTDIRADNGGFGGVALVLGLFGVCCGGPLLVGTLAATGLGAWLLASAGPALGGVALLAVAVAALWLRRWAWRVSRPRDAGCRARTTTSRSEVKP